MNTEIKLNRRATDKVLQAALSPADYTEFKTVAARRDWSDKKLTEKIIKLFLSELKGKPERINDL